MGPCLSGRDRVPDGRRCGTCCPLYGVLHPRAPEPDPSPLPTRRAGFRARFAPPRPPLEEPPTLRRADQSGQDVGRAQEKGGQRPIGPHLALAQAVQDALESVGEFGNVVQTEAPARPLDRVDATEDLVHQFSIAARPLEFDQPALDRRQVFDRLFEERGSKSCHIDTHFIPQLTARPCRSPAGVFRDRTASPAIRSRPPPSLPASGPPATPWSASRSG